MADAYRRYGETRRQQPHIVKGSRVYIEMPGRHYVTETDLLNASYELYLWSLPVASCGGETGKSNGGLDELPEIDDLNDLRGFTLWGSNQAMTAPSRFMGLGGHPEIPLPPNASSTLLVEGLPANCTRREVSHLFRPLVGYKEIRLVTKESIHSGGDPVVFCLVDFHSPAHAVKAMDGLQGYIFDEHDLTSGHIRLQLVCSPGARSKDGASREALRLI